MVLTYEAATDADIPVIFAQAKALVDAYEDRSAIDYDRVMAWMERKITKLIANYTRVCRDGEICAYYHLAQDGELDDFYVLPDFRGQGIGSAILTNCIREEKAPLWLYVFTENRRAMALYQRFGFRVQETVGTTRAIMRREDET